MRSQELNTALGVHLEAVAAHLQGELAEGAEVPFELERRGGRIGARRPALYCYRPLVGEFLQQRDLALQALPTHRDAALALADFDGLDRYLLDRGVEPEDGPPRERLRSAMLTLMEDAFGEHSDFQLQPERVERALAALQGAAASSSSEITVLARLRGLAITSAEVRLAGGLAIVREDSLPAPLPDTGSILGADRGEPVFVVLSSEAEDPRRALHGARAILAELLRGLRLFGDGRIALEALAWARVADGAWRPYQLATGGCARGTLVVTAEQEDELRAFCSLISRRVPEGNALAWALRRFELGCERASPLEALSDNLLALRALLEDDSCAPEAFAQRLGALCAIPEAAAGLADRALRAIALERAARRGQASLDAAAEALAGEIADHLRALLRDMICGHLQDDLIELAERILADAEAQADARAPAEAELCAEAEPPAAAEHPSGSHAEHPSGPEAEHPSGPEGEDPPGPEGEHPPRSQMAITPASLEEIFSHASQSEEILDVFI